MDQAEFMRGPRYCIQDVIHLERITPVSLSDAGPGMAGGPISNGDYTAVETSKSLATGSACPLLDWNTA